MLNAFKFASILCNAQLLYPIIPTFWTLGWWISAIKTVLAKNATRARQERPQPTKIQPYVIQQCLYRFSVLFFACGTCSTGNCSCDWLLYFQSGKFSLSCHPDHQSTDHLFQTLLGESIMFSSHRCFSSIGRTSVISSDCEKYNHMWHRFQPEVK